MSASETLARLASGADGTRARSFGVRAHVRNDPRREGEFVFHAMPLGEAEALWWANVVHSFTRRVTIDVLDDDYRITQEVAYP